MEQASCSGLVWGIFFAQEYEQFGFMSEEGGNMRDKVSGSLLLLYLSHLFSKQNLLLLAYLALQVHSN